MKNNDDFLKRRLEQLKERDFSLKKREFLLSKIRTNEFKLNLNLNDINQKKCAMSNKQIERSYKIDSNAGNFFDIHN